MRASIFSYGAGVPGFWSREEGVLVVIPGMMKEQGTVGTDRGLRRRRDSLSRYLCCFFV